MINLPKISFDWDLVREPEFYTAAQAELRQNALASIRTSVRQPNSDIIDVRLNMGDDFNKIYYFNRGHAIRQIIKGFEESVFEMTVMDTKDFEYGEDFLNSVSELIFRRFAEVSCISATIDTSFEDRADLLITTKQALQTAGFRFSSQYSVAYPPPQ